MVVMAIAELVLLGLVNGFGSDATAAYGAVNQIMGYAQFTAMSISISVSILGAQAIGGGHAGRLDAIVRTGLLLNLVLTGGLVALIYLFPRAVLGIFITDSRRARTRERTAHHRLVEFGAVRHGDRVLGRDAGRRRGPGSHAAVDLRHRRDRDTFCRDPEPDHRAGGVWAAYPIVFCAMFVLQLGYYTLVWRAARFSGWSDAGKSRIATVLRSS